MKNERRVFLNKVIPHLGVQLLTACNLNCRDCADLIPYRPVRFYEKRLFYSDINKILSVVNGIKEILLIGGEILLCKDLEEILAWCENESKIHSIVLTTNGTIVPSDALIKLMKHDKVTLRVSGYPESVVPARKEVIKIFRENGIALEDLDNMTWLDIGGNENRGRTPDEMTSVFQNCIMADCIGMQADGKIFYCSRQTAAYETDIYPSPSANEYVDIRNTPAEELIEKMERFYEIPYISTCDFCNGIVIGGRDNRLVPAATQLLDKNEFLELIELIDTPDSGEQEAYIRKCVKFINVYFEKLDGFSVLPRIVEFLTGANLSDADTASKMSSMMRSLASEVAEGFQFEVSVRSPSYERYVTRNTIYNRRNCISIGVIPDDAPIEGKEDILLFETELQKEAYSGGLMDEFDYGRLYLRAGYETKRKIEGVVAGLSYCQYGIDLSSFDSEIVNLAVGGLDIGYSIKMAEKFVERSNDVKWVALAIPYYSGFFDLESSERTFHKMIKKKVIYPTLRKGLVTEKVDSPFRNAFRFALLKDDIEEQYASTFDGKNYFNELHPLVGYGGMDCDFKTLSEKEKYERAIKTAKGNRSACKFENGAEIVRRLNDFSKRMQIKGCKVFLFTTPMTKYLRKQADPEVGKRFFADVRPCLSEDIYYMDLYDNETFDDEDFVDFEHLSSSGATKMSRILNAWIKENVNG